LLLRWCLRPVRHGDILAGCAAILLILLPTLLASALLVLTTLLLIALVRILLVRLVLLALLLLLLAALFFLALLLFLLTLLFTLILTGVVALLTTLIGLIPALSFIRHDAFSHCYGAHAPKNNEGYSIWVP